MTELSIPSQALPDTAAGADFPVHPSAMLLDLVLALLAPLFLGVSAGNVEIARLAALETVNAYRARNQADLLTVAQLFAFGLATLSSLSLSMADDLSLSMILRLRGSANALNRSAEKHRCAREREDHQAAPPQQALEGRDEPSEQPVDAPPSAPARTMTGVADASTPDALPSASMASRPTAPTASPAPHDARQSTLAAGVARSSQDCRAGLPHLQPAQRPDSSLRAAALSSTANGLLSGPTWESPAIAGRAAVYRHPTGT